MGFPALSGRVLTVRLGIAGDDTKRGQDGVHEKHERTYTLIFPSKLHNHSVDLLYLWEFQQRLAFEVAAGAIGG